MTTLANLAELHAEVVARLTELSAAVNAVIIAADAAAAVAEQDPRMASYVDNLMPLIDLMDPVDLMELPSLPAPNA